MCRASHYEEEIWHILGPLKQNCPVSKFVQSADSSSTPNTFSKKICSVSTPSPPKRAQQHEVLKPMPPSAQPCFPNRVHNQSNPFGSKFFTPSRALSKERHIEMIGTVRDSCESQGRLCSASAHVSIPDHPPSHAPTQGNDKRRMKKH